LRTSDLKGVAVEIAVVVSGALGALLTVAFLLPGLDWFFDW
jgi:hypothetical protein